MATTIDLNDTPPPGTVVWLDDQAFELVEIRDRSTRAGRAIRAAVWHTRCPECNAPFRTTSVLGGSLPTRRCREHRRPGMLVSGRRKIERVVIEPPIAVVIRTLRKAIGEIDRHFEMIKAAADLAPADMLAEADQEVRKLVDLVCELIANSRSVKAAFCNATGIDPDKLDGTEIVVETFRAWLAAPLRELRQ